MILIKHRRKKPKSEILNPKQYQMTKIQNTKQYDLEERTLKFAKRTIEFTKKLPKTIANNEVWNIGICNLRFV